MLTLSSTRCSIRASIGLARMGLEFVGLGVFGFRVYSIVGFRV